MKRHAALRPTASRLAAGLAAAALLAAPAAASGPGSSAAPFLRLAVGARASAMGGSGTGLAQGAPSLRYNPAGLGEIDRASVATEYVSGFAGIDRQYLGAVTPWGEKWGIGASVLRLDYGEDDRTLADAAGNFAGTAGRYDASDLAVEIGAGRRLGQYRVGASVGYVRQKIDDLSADGAYLSLGARWNSPDERWVLGGAVRNVGTRLTFAGQGVRPPAEARIGAAFRPVRRLSLALDLAYAEDGRGNLHGGVEWRPARPVALRAGYATTNDAGSGLTLGAGFEAEGAALDYAYAPFGDLGAEHRVTLTYSFGGGGGEDPVAKPSVTPKRTARVRK